MSIDSELPNEPIAAVADRSSVKQALLNLLENASKYAPEGKIVRITIARVDDSVRLRVSDDGPGIAPTMAARIFEPFVQGGRTLTDKSPGVGLGLTIARGLLRRGGGDLVLLPSAKGAHFEIRLPQLATS